MSATNPARIRRRRIVLPVLAGCALASAAPALALATAPSPTKAPETDLGIAKSSDRASYGPGETIVYSITVTNHGTAPVARADILVSDPMLADLAPADGAGTTGPDLAPGAGLVYVGTRIAAADECGPLSNTATVAVRGGGKYAPDANPGNDSATHVVDVGGERCAPPVAISGIARPVAPPSPPREAMPQSQPAVCPPPKLSVAVRAPRNLRAGASALFAVRVLNARGAAAARRAHLTVRLPAGFSLTRPIERSLVKDGAMRWSIGTLAPRAARSLSVRLRADRTASGPRALAATVSATCGSARAKALVRVAQAVAQQARPPVAG
jgi:uncharacterized repeat protein (TIGR01451 family)